MQRRASILAYAHIFPAELAPPPVARLLARWCDQLIGADGQAWPMVVELEEDVIGAVLARVNPDPEPEIAGMTVTTGEIWGLYVDPAFWGNGFGPMLLEAGTTRLIEAGLAEATLWVLEGNTRARTLYERAGWSADGATRTTIPTMPDIVELRYRRSLTERA